MKSLILILSLFFSLAAFGQQPEYPDSGFTNKAEAKNLIVNGQKEGKWVIYYGNLNLRLVSGDKVVKRHTRHYELVVYKHDKLYGVTQRYDNGKLSWRKTYKNGKVNGIIIKYNEDGSKWQEATYINDTLLGPEKEYRNGKIYIENWYTNHIIDSEENFYDNGLLSVRRVFTDNGNKIIEQDYDEVGKLMQTQYQFITDSSYYVKYYRPNGKLKFETFYKRWTTPIHYKEFSPDKGKAVDRTYNYLNEKVIFDKSYDENGIEIKQ